MDGRPNIVIATSALAIIGGIVAIASFVCGFYDHTDNLFGSMGLGLLITVLFFAEAGFLYSDGKGNHYSFLFMSFANAIAIIAGIYFEAINLWCRTRDIGYPHHHPRIRKGDREMDGA